MDIKQLKEPFMESEYEWRVQNCGMHKGNPWAMVLCYVTNRAIMDRLDDVCGPDNWQNELKPLQDGMLCGISIKIGDEWITKWDGSQNTDIEATKGGISKSMVRAAVQWGIGRHLYKLDATFADTSLEKIEGWNKAKGKDQSNKFFTFYWKTPTLPDWAISKRDAKPKTKPKEEPKEEPEEEEPPKPNFRKVFWADLKKASNGKITNKTNEKIVRGVISDICNDERAQELCEQEGCEFPLSVDMDIDSVGWTIMSNMIIPELVAESIKLHTAKFIMQDKKKKNV